MHSSTSSGLVEPGLTYSDQLHRVALALYPPCVVVPLLAAAADCSWAAGTAAACRRMTCSDGACELHEWFTLIRTMGSNEALAAAGKPARPAARFTPPRTRRLRPKAMCVTLLCALSLVPVAGATTAPNRSDPASPLAFAPVRLEPVSARVVGRCRSIQALVGRPLLRPTLLPHASAGGLPDLLPRALAVTPIGDFFHRRIGGVDIGYGSPWEGPQGADGKPRPASESIRPS